MSSKSESTVAKCSHKSPAQKHSGPDLTTEAIVLAAGFIGGNGFKGMKPSV
jgi:hypothetical protein